MARKFPLVAVLAAMAVALGMLGCEKESPTEPTPNCSLAISPSALAFASEGGQGVVTVSVATGCTWTATSGASWLTITEGANGSGAGAVKYTVAANPDTQARTATMTIGGQVHSVAQQGRVAENCQYAISPDSASLSSDGGGGSFNVTAPASCSWTATSSNPSWLTITSGAQGSGNGSVTFAATRNASVDNRNAAIVVADRTFNVTQSADVSLCQYGVAPVQVGVCMRGFVLTTTVTTSPSCPWTAASSVDWMSITQGSSGVGSGIVKFQPTDNWDALREGIIQLRWPAPTAGQNVHVTQGGCTRTVIPDEIPIGPPGGPGSFQVISTASNTPATGDCGGRTGDTCYTLAESSDSWIHVTTGASYDSILTINFTVDRNPDHISRHGTITLRHTNTVVRIDQGWL